MAKKLDHKFWAKYFKYYDVLNMVIPYQELLETIIQEADIKKGEIVLDAGCGTGNLAIKIKEKGATVVGADNCIEALDRYRIKDPGAEIIVHDLSKPLPFGGNNFDKIVCNNVIYALGVEERPKVIREFFKALKPGGVLAISDPNPKTRPVAIYYSHIRSSFRIHGVLKTAFRLMKFAVITLIMMRLNKRIVKVSRPIFSSEAQRKKLFQDAGFVVEKVRGSYVGQASLIIGRKNA